MSELPPEIAPLADPANEVLLDIEPAITSTAPVPLVDTTAAPGAADLETPHGT